jgi:hypothetical protein
MVIIYTVGQTHDPEEVKRKQQKMAEEMRQEAEQEAQEAAKSEDGNVVDPKAT